MNEVVMNYQKQLRVATRELNDIIAAARPLLAEMRDLVKEARELTESLEQRRGPGRPKKEAA